MLKLLPRALFALLIAQTVNGIAHAADPIFTDKLFSQTPQESALYGSQVAIDSTWALVSSPGFQDPDNELSTANDGVRVYERDSTGNWTLDVKLEPAGTIDSDFGVRAVAMDNGTAVISATDSDGAGALWIFVRDESGWDGGTRIQAPQPLADDRFGWSVDLDGDRLIVYSIAPPIQGQSVTPIRPGRVHVMQRQTSGEWLEQSQLTLDLTENDSVRRNFGFPAAVSGDTIAIGSSSIYIYEFDNPTASWRQTQNLQPPTEHNLINSGYGFYLNLDSGRLAVGSLGLVSQAEAAIPSQVISIFEKNSSSSWVRTSALELPEPFLPGQTTFGGPISFAGDDILAIATSYQVQAPVIPTPSLYHFVESDGVWAPGVVVELPPVTGGSGEPRAPVSIAADGVNAIVGAPGDDSLGGGIALDNGSIVDAGAAYLINVNPLPDIAITVTPDSQTIDAGGSAEFSVSVTNAGNIRYDNAISVDSPTCENRIYQGPGGGNPFSLHNLNQESSGTLAPGATWSFTCSSQPLTASLNAVFNASVTAFQSSNLDSAEAEIIVRTGSFTIETTVSPEPVVTGQGMTLTTVITNTGDIPIHNLSTMHSASFDSLNDVFKQCDEEALALVDGSALESGASVTDICIVDEAPDTQATITVDARAFELNDFDIEINRQSSVDYAVIVPSIDFTSPTNGATLTSADTTFEWEAVSIDIIDWWLYVDYREGGAFYFNSGALGTQTSALVENLPTDGSALTARLWYRVNGSEANDWQFIDRTFIASGQPPIITSPALGDDMMLFGASATFEWDPRGSQAQEYWLYAGSSVGGDEFFNSGRLGNTMSAVAGYLPFDAESTVYVRLWYKTTRVPWKYVDAVYTAGDGGGLPFVIAPEEESIIDTLPSTSFTWDTNGTGATEWWVYAGASPGEANYFSSGSLDSAVNSIELTRLPADGTVVWVRLWYRVGATDWRFIDSQYLARNVQPLIEFDVENPAGDVLDIIWEDASEGEAGIDAWWLYVGSEDDETLYLNTLELPVETTQATATGLIRDSRINVVRLWYRVDALWRSVVATVALDP